METIFEEINYDFQSFVANCEALIEVEKEAEKSKAASDE